MADLQNKLNQWMENPVVVGLLAIGVTMYGPRLSPKLPDFIRTAFNSGFFRFLIILLVIFVGFRSIRLAIVIAVLFLMIVSIANQQSIKEDFNKQVREYYANYNLFKLGNIEHFDTDAKPQQGNDVQNDDQGLYDYDEDDDEDVPQTGAAVNMSEELQPVVDFVNNPNSGMSSKCRSYWNSIAGDSQGCIQELEARARENPELLKVLNAQMAGAANNVSNGVNMGDKIKNIEKKISDACAAFRGSA